MSAREARLEMNSVLKHDLDACPEIDDTLIYPGSIDDAWLMPWHNSEHDMFFRLWFLEHFASRQVYRQALSMCDEVDRFWSDMAKLHYADTGDSSYMSPVAKRALKARMLTAMFPTWKSVVDEATGVHALKAQKNLNRLVIENGLWQEKS